MTPDELYNRGYSDGFHGVARHSDFEWDDSYELGYADGEGDKKSGATVMKVKSAFIVDDFDYNLNPAPEGYYWTGEYRTPEKGEIYFTKNGNAGVAKSDPKNGRKRHMLAALRSCPGHYGYISQSSRTGLCKLAVNHKGQCSNRQTK